MARVEWYIGTSGPYFADDTDAQWALPEQVARKQDVLDSQVNASDTVEDETTFGISPGAGTAEEYSRADHTHGTPDNPAAGVTQDITVVTAIGPPLVTATLHFTDGLLTSVT